MSFRINIDRNNSKYQPECNGLNISESNNLACQPISIDTVNIKTCIKQELTLAQNDLIPVNISHEFKKTDTNNNMNDLFYKSEHNFNFSDINTYTDLNTADGNLNTADGNLNMADGNLNTADGNLNTIIKHINYYQINSSVNSLNNTTFQGFYVNSNESNNKEYPAYGFTTKKISRSIAGETSQNDPYIVYTCLENTEMNIYYRGEAEIISREALIKLPDNVHSIATDFTIQLTQISEELVFGYSLTCSKVNNGVFTVYGIPCKFFWQVQGRRII